MPDDPTADIRVLDSRDYALVLVVSPVGVLEIKGCTVSRQQAATWLREAANVLEKRA
jgi:hypothetical protein